MKKQIFTIILLLMGGVSAFGQSFKLDATGTNDMRLRTSNADRLTILPTTGNVGIGTITPDAKLHVNGDLILVPYSYTPPTSFTGDPFNRIGKSYMSLNPPTGVTTIIKGIDGGTVDRYGLMLFISCGGEGTVILKNNSSTLPANKINTNTGADITITGRGGATLVYDADGWRVVSYDNGQGTGWNLGGNAATNSTTDFIGTTDAQPLAFKTNNAENMRILANGNVGIGTTTPDAKLDLFGDFRLSRRAIISTVGTHDALNRSGSSIIYFNISGTATLNGIADGIEGMVMYIYVGSLGTLIINHQNAPATIDDILTNTGTSLTISGRGGATLIYGSGGWRVIGFAD